MTLRLLLVAPVAGEDAADPRFGDDGPPAPAALAAAGAHTLRSDGPVPVSGTARCRATAGALGLAPVPGGPDLAAWDTGAWRGRTLSGLAAEDPEALRSWLSDPHFAPERGESLAALCARVARWLDGLAATRAGRLTAVVEPEIVRAAVVHALAAPPAAFWRLDVRPLTCTEFTARADRWNVLPGRPPGPA